jgi:hypothetical protein
MKHLNACANNKCNLITLGGVNEVVLIEKSMYLIFLSLQLFLVVSCVFLPVLLLLLLLLFLSLCIEALVCGVLCGVFTSLFPVTFLWACTHVLTLCQTYYSGLS